MGGRGRRALPHLPGRRGQRGLRGHLPAHLLLRLHSAVGCRARRLPALQAALRPHPAHGQGGRRLRGVRGQPARLPAERRARAGRARHIPAIPAAPAAPPSPRRQEPGAGGRAPRESARDLPHLCGIGCAGELGRPCRWTCHPPALPGGAAYGPQALGMNIHRPSCVREHASLTTTWYTACKYTN